MVEATLLTCVLLQTSGAWNAAMFGSNPQNCTDLDTDIVISVSLDSFSFYVQDIIELLKFLLLVAARKLFLFSQCLLTFTLDFMDLQGLFT